jgi:hypothetical protein
VNNGRIRTRALVALVVAIATPAIGADIERTSIYGWRDDADIQHYTNEIGDVPETYRTRATTIVKDWTTAEQPPQETVCRAPDNTLEPKQASATSVLQSSAMAPQANVTEYVDASRSSSVLQDTQVAPPQTVVFDDLLLPLDGRATHHRARFPREDFQPRGTVTQNPAGPPPLGAAGRPLTGFAGRGSTSNDIDVKRR